MSDHVIITMEDGSRRVVYWPMCATPGCENRVCLGVPDTDRCYPCSAITEAQLDLFRRPFTYGDGQPA